MTGQHVDHPHPALQRVVRWTPRRKEEVLLAVRKGELTADEVEAAHHLAAGELKAWDHRHRLYGRPGLSVTHLQELH